MTLREVIYLVLGVYWDLAIDCCCRLWSSLLKAITKLNYLVVLQVESAWQNGQNRDREFPQ